MNDVFWDLTLCGSSKKYRRFGGTYPLHLQGNETPSLSSEVVPHDGRRRETSPTFVLIPYCGVIVDVLLLRRMCLD
jgi:hypothetical protein